MKKRILSLALAIILIATLTISLTACSGGKTLSGKYVNVERENDFIGFTKGPNGEDAFAVFLYNFTQRSSQPVAAGYYRIDGNTLILTSENGSSDTMSISNDLKTITDSHGDVWKKE